MRIRRQRNAPDSQAAINPDSTRIRAMVGVIEPRGPLRTRIESAVKSSLGFALQYTFADIQAALDSLALHPPNLVVLGIPSPPVDCTATLRYLRQIAPATRTLVLADDFDLPWVHNALGAGAAGLLERSTCHSNPQRLIEDLSSVAAGGSPLPARVRRLLLRRYQVGAQPGAPGQALTSRELAIVEFWASGLIDKQIAERLGITHETVKTHAKHILEKLNAHTRIEAFAKLWRFY